jgi:hypothetical protein
MVRYLAFIVAAFMSLGQGYGMIYGRQDLLPAGQDAAPFSVHTGYPAANAGMPAEYETISILGRVVTVNDTLRWPAPSRIPHPIFPGVCFAGLMAILLVWRERSGIKSRRVPFRLCFIPLGSHAPPAAMSV